MRPSVPRLVVAAAIVVATIGPASAWVTGTSARPPAPVTAERDRAFRAVAAGDIACDPANPAFNGGRGVGGWCRAAATARVARRLEPDAVLALGDLQYDDGRRTAFEVSYDASWGAFHRRVRPVLGNHEYWYEPGARGYFAYFRGRAGERGDGWYSFDANGWHVVALNSNCDRIACGPRSRQVKWLRADLEGSAATCTLAIMHHPLVSSGPHGDDPLLTGALWDVLYEAGTDVALASHDHLYERFARLRPDLRKDPATGIRTFVVGTGGAQHYPVEERATHSQQVNTTSFGVLELALRSGSYRWRFVPAAGGTYRDSGSETCHGAPAA